MGSSLACRAAEAAFGAASSAASSVAPPDATSTEAAISGVDVFAGGDPATALML